jgi:hypothetical protein
MIVMNQGGWSVVVHVCGRVQLSIAMARVINGLVELTLVDLLSNQVLLLVLLKEPLLILVGVIELKRIAQLLVRSRSVIGRRGLRIRIPHH